MTTLSNIVLMEAFSNVTTKEQRELLTVFVSPTVQLKQLPVLLHPIKKKQNPYILSFTKTIGFARNKVVVSEEFRQAVELEYEKSALYGKEIFNVAILRVS